MRPGIWQLTTASLAIGCLTFAAPAQFDAGGDQGQADQQTEQRGDQAGEETLGAESSQELRLGTVDLTRVSEAYKKSQDKKDQQARGEQESDQQAQGEEGDDLQAPAQADAFGQRGDDSGIDQQMLNEIRDQAREVADEEGVDLIVLEVLHDEQGADFQTIDLTDQVVQRIEEGEEGGQESDPLMNLGNEDDSEEGADTEESEEEAAPAW